VIAGSLHEGRFALRDLHRFPNGPVKIGTHFHTDFDALWREVQVGLAKAGGEPAGIGVDTWGVDYGLLDGAGALIGPPYHYRDARTTGVMDQIFRVVPKGEVFRVTGIQFMQINTLYQVFAATRGGDAHFERAATMLFTPDLFHYHLCGVKVAEYTIASTSQMLDAHERN
jgi:sugar (pentulose or hexulose) kinase